MKKKYFIISLVLFILGVLTFIRLTFVGHRAYLKLEIENDNFYVVSLYFSLITFINFTVVLPIIFIHKKKIVVKILYFLSLIPIVGITMILIFGIFLVDFTDHMEYYEETIEKNEIIVIRDGFSRTADVYLKIGILYFEKNDLYIGYLNEVTKQDDTIYIDGSFSDYKIYYNSGKLVCEKYNKKKE